MLKATLIDKTDELKTIEINVDDIETYTINKGYGKISQLHIWKYENLEVIIYGWENGHRKNINKHELPSPLDNNLFYGDLVVLLKENEEYDDFPKEDYNEFYEYMFGGFDSCNSTDDTDLDNDEYDFNDGFLVKD